MVAVVGTILSFATTSLMLEIEDEKVFIPFQNAALDRVSAIESIFETSSAALSSLSAIYDVVPTFRQKEFSAAAKKFLKSQEIIQFYGWAPKIGKEQIQEYRRAARQDIDPDFEFKETNGDMEFRALQDREYYLPVYFLEPMRGVKQYLGMDLATTAESRDTIDRAIKTKQTAATRLVKVRFNNQDINGILLVHPLFDRYAPNTFIGLICGLIVVDHVVEKKILRLSDSADINVALFDIGDDRSLQQLYPKGKALDVQALQSSPLKITKQINVMGRNWEIIVTPARGAYAVVKWPAYLMLGDLLLMTLTLSAFAFFAAHGQAALKKIVDERTHKLNESLVALSKAKDDAIEATKTKSDFLANMSHEIRTPLNGVIAAAELLWETELSDYQKKYVSIMRSSGEMLLAVINDILDLSKLEAGKVVLEPALLDVVQEAEITANIFAAQASAKKIEFTHSIDPEVPRYFVADLFRVRQILANLINNAIKYTEHGHVEKKVSVVEHKGRKFLRYTVSDTGPGIPLDLQKFIFEKFTQLKKDDRIAGTGLGLSICKALIDLMGGRIGVISDGVNGSVFWFEFPLIVVDACTLPQTRQTFSAGRENHAGCKVLLAEDVEMNRIIAVDMLEKFGCEVDAVANGEQAVVALEHKNYDIIFMDCQMPVLNGYEATQKIRAQGNKTPIIALTAHAFNEEVEKCLAAGMNDFVSKPLLRDILLKTLDKWHVAQHKKAGNGMPIQHPLLAKTVDISGMDTTNLHMLFETFPDKASRLIGVALRDGNKYLAEMEKAFLARDGVQISGRAHALKSIAKQMGGIDVGDLCDQLEKDGAAGDFDKIGSLFQKLRVAYPVFFKTVREYALKNKA